MFDPTAETVTKLYLEHIGLPKELNPDEQQQFLTHESERISNRVDNMRVEMQEQVLTRYQKENGEPAPYREQVRLINQAWKQALDWVITEEIYGQHPELMGAYPPDMESAAAIIEQEQARIQVHASDPERWREPLNCRDSHWSTGQLNRSLWGDRPKMFRYFGTALLQARIDDGQPVPTSQTDPLFPSFTALLEARTAEYERNRK